MAILPAGTGNDFYFSMGNQAVKKLYQRIQNPKFVQCDVGRCVFKNRNGTESSFYFICSIGMCMISKAILNAESYRCFGRKKYSIAGAILIMKGFSK